MFYVLCFMFYVLCFMFYVLCFMFYVLLYYSADFEFNSFVEEFIDYLFGFLAMECNC